MTTEDRLATLERMLLETQRQVLEKGEQILHLQTQVAHLRLTSGANQTFDQTHVVRAKPSPGPMVGQGMPMGAGLSGFAASELKAYHDLCRQAKLKWLQGQQTYLTDKV